jgi:hypothetical protein
VPVHGPCPPVPPSRGLQAPALHWSSRGPAHLCLVLSRAARHSPSAKNNTGTTWPCYGLWMGVCHAVQRVLWALVCPVHAGRHQPSGRHTPVSPGTTCTHGPRGHAEGVPAYSKAVCPAPKHNAAAEVTVQHQDGDAPLRSCAVWNWQICSGKRQRSGQPTTRRSDISPSCMRICPLSHHPWLHTGDRSCMVDSSPSSGWQAQIHTLTKSQQPRVSAPLSTLA